MKSERTKTNACVGRSRRCSPRNSRPCETVSAGASKLRSNVPGSARASVRGGAPERLALGVVEVAGEAARGDRRSGAISSSAVRIARGLSSVRSGDALDRHRRPAVAEHDDARRLVGEALAHDELVGPARGREAGRRRPVHPADVVARAVLARARDVGADAAARAAHAAEGEADHPPSRDEREDRGHSTPSRPPERRGRCRSRASARRSRQRARTLEARRLPAAVADLGEEARPEEDAVHEHRHEQLLDVLRRDVAARVQHAPTRARRG